MITVNLCGRTGNNMFQIAAAIALAERCGTSAHYIGDDSHIKGLKLKGVSSVTKEARKKFREKMFAYDEAFEKLGNNINLDGYFQSEKYFISSEDNVRRCFAFNQETVDFLNKHGEGKYRKFLKGERSTALHVRRTDYLKHPDIYPEFDSNYYQECLDMISDKGKILVFSDDIEWCRNNIKCDDCDFVTMPPMPSMYLMSNCTNVIMANSTFSWWASWLGEPEKVIYPKKWFGENWPFKDQHGTLDECLKSLFPSNPKWIGH